THVVEKRSARPALNRTAVRCRQTRFTLHKSIRPGGAVADGKIMATVLGKTAQKQSLLAHRKKSGPPPAGVFRNRRERTAIRHGHAPSPFLNRHRRTGKTLETNLAHPSVSGIFQRDPKPRMVLIFGIVFIERGFEPPIFHADIFNMARPGIL